jgi:hypothetical protein
VKSLAEAADTGNSIGAHLESAAGLWLAYPKGTSKRYEADLFAIPATPGCSVTETGVSMASIDEDRSALRPQANLTPSHPPGNQRWPDNRR